MNFHKTIKQTQIVTDRQRLLGEFYTPLPFAKKALEYIEKMLGKQWWKSGKYRLWDMAAGTGNLEYFLPEDALKYCYLSTIDDSDVEYLKKVFSDATIFQYDYLNDDVDHLFAENGNTLKLEHSWKLPETLRNDLPNPKIKWIVLINPPFATAQEAGMKGKSKAQVAETRIRFYMHYDHLGEVSRELSSQFIYRIKKEFEGKSAYFGLFSKLTYLIANNDQRLRDRVFRFDFLRGFTFSSAHFYGTSKNSPFPVGFLLWDLSKQKNLETQTIKLEIYNEHGETYSHKIITADAREHHLSKWIVRPPTTITFPPFCSAITLGSGNVDRRDRIAEGFLASFMCPGNDLQNQRRTAFLSGPQASAGALSVMPNNFEQSVVVFAARLIPKVTWLNDRDQLMMPNRKLSKTFISDCAVWALFHNANQTVAMKNVTYEGKVYQVVNYFFPFLPSDFAGGAVADADMERSRKQIAATYVADWLAKQKLSPLSDKLLALAKQIYALFYGSLDVLRIPKFKIETFDAGWWQIRKALQDVQRCDKEFASLKVLHDQLRAKLLPQLVDCGIVRDGAA